MKLPVGDIVQQRSELNHCHVGTGLLCNTGRHLPYPVHVPPVMPSCVALYRSFHVLGGLIDQVCSCFHK